MELQVGMYVRTKEGIITKIKDFWERRWGSVNYARFYCENDEIYEYEENAINTIKKPSFNKIDLIEKLDAIILKNDSKDIKHTVIDIDIDNNLIWLYGFETAIFQEDIKSIVTKEQFADREYKF